MPDLIREDLAERGIAREPVRGRGPAEARAARGDTNAATVELRAARELFTSMRAPRLVECAGRVAERLGVSLEDVPSAGGSA